MLAAQDANWVVRAPGTIERIEACFSGAAFSPHRHDTYAIGITLKGVQSFDYRGGTRHSLPGQLVVLHPDERHDGRAGDGGSFRYRTAYVAPAAIQDVLGGKPLPFVAGGVSGDPGLRRAIVALLADYGRAPTEFEQQDALYDLATALQAICGGAGPITPVQRIAALQARDYIDANIGRNFSLHELERATRHSRWQLSRDFRRLFGTSPYRYAILRRLDKARCLMLAGHSTAEAASASGFADQSHFGKLFKKSFGLTPNAWLRATRSTHDRSIFRSRVLPH
ncbi:MAG TPA: AraC family transcriptional regulator [Rhizomicrobium sp.]|jgi:AraC-like DNA-binding protein|nr:AraC family transcriptional regulator [Rhizomicrobium sp.]